MYKKAIICPYAKEYKDEYKGTFVKCKNACNPRVRDRHGIIEENHNKCTSNSYKDCAYYIRSNLKEKEIETDENWQIIISLITVVTMIGLIIRLIGRMLKFKCSFK